MPWRRPCATVGSTVSRSPWTRIAGLSGSRRAGSSRLSAMNRERVRRLIAARRMTKAGLARIAHVFDHESDTKRKLEWRGPPHHPAGAQKKPTTLKKLQDV